MVATVIDSRKRGPAAFLDDPFPHAPRLTKRGRCAPTAADLGLCMPLEFDPLDALQLIFPGAEPQVLQNYLVSSGNVLDAAIRGFKEYQSTSGNTAKLGSAMSNAPSSNGADDVVSSSEAASVLPTVGSEWAQLFVREMSSASDLVDAKNRAVRILELFKKSIEERINPDATEEMHEEHKTLKQMLGALIQQNGVLKRAYLIQHNRNKDYEEKAEELAEIVEKCQEQIKALEAKNYVLSFHLEQAKQHRSISGQCNPDVF